MAQIYEGREAKSIQRRMVVDALRRLSNVTDPKGYQYIGLGGLEFFDFIEVHNALGITSMTTIERDPMIFDRVEFNRPYAGIQIELGTTSDVLPTIDWKAPSITWLDYTSPLDESILNDVDLVVRSSQPGSFVIVTVNAEAGRVSDRAQTLTGRLPVSLANGVDSWNLGSWGVAAVHRDLLEKRASSVSREAHAGSFAQLFNLVYRDGARMQTWGGLVLNPVTAGMVEACHFDNLSYVRRSEDLLEVRYPTLTERERRHLERELSSHDGSRPRLKGVDKADVQAFEEVYRWRSA